MREALVDRMNEKDKRRVLEEKENRLLIFKKLSLV